MTPDLRFLVVRRDVDNAVPFEVGDEVTTYELFEPYPYAHLREHGGHTRELELYEDEVAERDFVDANFDEVWREQAEFFCDCPDGRKLASVLVHRQSKRLWVSFRAERAPRAHRRESQNVAFPLHGDHGDQPHVDGPTSCPKCGRHWLVLAFEDRVVLAKIKRAHFGAKVRP